VSIVPVEYHIVIIPVYPWDDIKVNNIDTLKKLIKIMDGLFKFQLSPDSIVQNTTSLFSGRIAHVTHEVPYIYDITTAAKAANKELISNGSDLKIENAYATKYAIELVSNSSDIYKLNNYQYEVVCDKLSELLFEGMSRSHCYQSAIAKIILCDNLTEAKAIAVNSGLQKITEELYIEKRKLPPVMDRVFNFRSDLWAVSYLSNPIVTVKPEAISDYHTTDELSFLLMMIHSLGKFYSVFRSMRSVSASLEVSSWSLSELLNNYEARFCWVQRNFQNIEKQLYKFEQQAREIISFWMRLSSSFDSIIKVYREYGEDFLNLEWGTFKYVLENQRFKNYFNKKASSRLEKFIVDEIVEFASQISDFWKEFSKVCNSWKDNRRSIVEHHQLLLSLIGIFSAIVVDILLRIIFPK
jgi:hypothetical protein